MLLNNNGCEEMNGAGVTETTVYGYDISILFT